MDWLAALRVPAEANVLSTLVSVPLSWFGLLLLEMAALGSSGLLTQNPPAWLSYAMLPSILLGLPHPPRKTCGWYPRQRRGFYADCSSRRYGWNSAMQPGELSFLLPTSGSGPGRQIK
jgi:hypothetical protein